jgi:UDP-2,4-diacetamido-2,4,6-trideoxy-beta-L-altropyranose hydrolase
LQLQNRKKIIFLTEAGEGIGFGHLVRCSAIKEFIESNGNSANLLVDFKGETNNDQAFKIFDWRLNLGAVLEEKADVVLIDSYLAEGKIYKQLFDAIETVIAIDDYQRLEYFSHYLINPNIYGDQFKYNSQAGKILTGRDYVILRNEILFQRNYYAPREHFENLLISIGGSDIRNLLPALIAGLDEENFNITVIAGNENYRSKLSEIFFKTNVRIEGKCSASEMAKHFLKADIVISGGGQTLHELAYLGIPTIGILIDHDQAYNLDYYHRAGFLKSLTYWNDKCLIKTLRNDLEKMRMYSIRKDLFEIGRRLIDGRGVERIFNSVFR